MQYHIQKKHKQNNTRDGLMTGFRTHLQRTVTKEVVCVISTAREQFLG